METSSSRLVPDCPVRIYLAGANESLSDFYVKVSVENAKNYVYGVKIFIFDALLNFWRLLEGTRATLGILGR
jgi:hypothetical protein